MKTKIVPCDGGYKIDIGFEHQSFTLDGVWERHEAIWMKEQLDACFTRFKASWYCEEDTIVEIDDFDLAQCGSCNSALTLVRPGKHQCDNPDCETNGGVD